MLSPAPLIAGFLAAIGVTNALPQDRLNRRQAVGPWAQCGGNGYTGSKTCTAGYHCQASNEWYSQCLPGAGTSSAASTKVSVTTSMTMKTKPVETTPTTKSTATKPTSAPSSTATGTPFRWLGRVNPSTRELTWPGTGLAFSFTGTSATITIDRATGTNSLQLIVDNLPPKRIDNISGATTITTPPGLSSGKHTVTLRKTSESLFGSVFIPTSPITTSGTLNAAPVPKSQRLEILGDSISVGYGVEGELPCTNTAALENGTATYGAVAARELGADYDIVAWSGKGVVRNLNPGPLLPELWTRWGANDADGSYDFDSRPDPTWVVVNLGTNDFSYLGSRDPLNATVYKQGLVSFGKSIQAEYPDAEIFLTSSPMLSDGYPAGDEQKSTQVAALKGAVETLGAKAHFVDFPSQGSDVGCDYHPTAETQMSLGEILAEAIGEVEGN